MRYSRNLGISSFAAALVGFFAVGFFLAWACSGGPKDDEEPSYATGLVLPDNWADAAPWEPVTFPTAMPESFTLTNLPPIKNQGNCGSCWSFSVTAVVEYLNLGLTGVYRDLSEQTMVSTCSNSGSCQGGYFSAFDYVLGAGLPDEQDDPYLARNSSCKNAPPRVKISRWAYVGERGREPTTDEIKAAIMTYGMVSVTIAAGGSLQGHRGGGIYSACDATRQDHMVNLYGFETVGGQTVWLLRNSWGTGWGSGGVARILAEKNGRKCNSVGSITAFAVPYFDPSFYK